MITGRDNDQWTELASDSVAVLRALTDWAADILTIIRQATTSDEHAELTDAKQGSAYWHAERLHMGLAGRSTGGTVTTKLNTGEFALAGVTGRKQLLHKLADEYARMLSVLNLVSDTKGLHWLAFSHTGMPYWQAERAHTAVLALLSGSETDGQWLHELWSDNHESTAHNLEFLARLKRGESVIVTVAADDNSATIVTPDGATHNAGRIGARDGFWVGGETGTDEKVIPTDHSSAWLGLAQAVMAHHGYDPNTPVIIEQATTSPSTPT